MQSRTLRLSAWILGWALIAFGTLALRFVPGDYSHAVCGPWGCLPPIQALAAMHAFWVVIILPPVVWADRAWTAWRKLVMGRTVVLLALGGLVAVIVHDAASRHFGISRSDALLPIRRAAVAIVTQVDLPLVQALLAGAVWWFRGRRESVAPRSKPGGGDPQGRSDRATEVDDRHWRDSSGLPPSPRGVHGFLDDSDRSDAACAADEGHVFHHGD